MPPTNSPTKVRRRDGYWEGLEAEKTGLEARLEAISDDEAKAPDAARLTIRIKDIDRQLGSAAHKRYQAAEAERKRLAKEAAEAAKESRPG